MTVRRGWCEVIVDYRPELSQQHGYFHGALADREQAGSRIASGENAGRARNRFPDNAGGEAVDMPWAEFAEKVIVLQQRAPVGVAKIGWSILEAGHGPTIADTLAE